MDLIELQRTESRKVWMFCILFVGFCALTMVEFWWDEDINSEDVITECIEVIQDQESYEDDDVDFCRRTLSDLIKSRMRITT